MSDDRTELSHLTGPELVRVFLHACEQPRTTVAERAAFFDVKARVFAAIADRNDDLEAAEAADRARIERDRLLSEPTTDKAANGGGL